MHAATDRGDVVCEPIACVLCLLCLNLKMRMIHAAIESGALRKLLEELGEGVVPFLISKLSVEFTITQRMAEGLTGSVSQDKKNVNISA